MNGVNNHKRKNKNDLHKNSCFYQQINYAINWHDVVMLSLQFWIHCTLTGLADFRLLHHNSGMTSSIKRSLSFSIKQI